jgi:hypothetical protein
LESPEQIFVGRDNWEQGNIGVIELRGDQRRWPIGWLGISMALIQARRKLAEHSAGIFLSRHLLIFETVSKKDSLPRQ